MQSKTGWEYNEESEPESKKRKDTIRTTPIDEMRFTPASFHPEAMPTHLGDSKRFTNLLAASSPGGIEQQEAEGQQKFVNGTQLPIKINSGPRVGAEKIYTDMGIKVLGIDGSDPIFFNVELPAGWTKKPTDHSMWSNLLDEKGRERGSIFFKAAFYDYEAFFNVTNRFYLQAESVGNTFELTYEQREALPKVGRVYDGEKIVFETEYITQEIPLTREERDEAYWRKVYEIKESLLNNCKKWMESMGLSEYEDYTKYWDIDIDARMNEK